MTRTELRLATCAFERAVDMAARGSGDVNERLVLAYREHLVTLPAAALPEPLRGRFLRLHDQICDRPPGGPVAAYTARLRALYPEQAAELLARLVGLKNALRLLLEEQEA